MATPPDMESARTALRDCGATLEKIDKSCCIPNRRPCIQEIGEALSDAATSLDVAADPAAAEMVLVALEDAGAQVGKLQVGCCASNRIPLYASILEGLTIAQLAVSEALGQGH